MGRPLRYWHEAAVRSWILHRNMTLAERWDIRARERKEPSWMSLLEEEDFNGDRPENAGDLFLAALCAIRDSGLEAVNGLEYHKRAVIEYWPRINGRPKAELLDKKLRSAMAKYMLGIQDDIYFRETNRTKCAKLVRRNAKPYEMRTTLQETARAFGFTDIKSPSFRRIWPFVLIEAELLIDAFCFEPIDLATGIIGSAPASDLELVSLRQRLDTLRQGAVRGRRRGSKNKHG
jgi:hypothetical protein